MKRDLEVLCLLEVQVSVLEGSWRRFWSLGVLKSFEVLEAILSLEVYKCWIGALWRYFEALDVLVCTFQHCKS
jgi:hypothetical protein